jgi:hypothetical protein
MGNFSETDNCTTVTPTATCTINGVFAPASAGALTGQFSIASNSASSPDLIALSGFGTQTGATLTPSSISFGHITVGGSSNISNLTLTNTGNTALTLNTPTLTGSNPGDFAFRLILRIDSSRECDLPTWSDILPDDHWR